MTLVYITILWVVLCGFVSLGVDLGHVQLVKTQLQKAADAACRAACNSFITDGVSQAQNDAINWAALNTCDGQSVVISSSDVEFGTWDSVAKTFTTLSGVARSSANALRVTARRTKANGNPVNLSFGGVIGAPSIDLVVPVIAMVTSGGGIVGINSVSITGNAYTDSYNSGAGPYSAGSAMTNGGVSSNGNITVGGSGRIRGDARPGPGGSVNLSGVAYVTGSTATQNQTQNYATPALPATYTDGGAFSLTGSATATLTAGNYHYTSFTMGNSAVLTVSGPVTIYVDGNVSLGGNSTIAVPGNRPQYFRIRTLVSGTVTVNNGVSVYADIYAPLSSVSITGAGGLYGTATGKTLTLSNSGFLHYDESLGYGSAGSSVISTVR